MAIYTFNTVLLSAAKASTPPMTNTALSGSGVGIVSLSAADIGISFNALTPLLGSIVYVNVLGSLFGIDTAYQGSTFSVLTQTGATTFTFLSSVTTVPLTAISTGNTVSTPDDRRKRYLGYK